MYEQYILVYSIFLNTVMVKRWVICFVFLQDRENAQSSCAGLFIGSHLGFDWPGVWVHVDIASPVHAVSRRF